MEVRERSTVFWLFGGRGGAERGGEDMDAER